MDVGVFNNNTWNRFMFYDEDTLFYSNLKDDHKFYIEKGKVKKKISEVKPKNIVGNKKKIYYTDNIEGRIYELDYDGNNEKIIYEPYPYEVEYIKSGVEKIRWYPSYEGAHEHSSIIDFYDNVSNTVIGELSIWENYLIFREGESLSILDLNTNINRNVLRYVRESPVPYNIIPYKDKIYYINDIDYRIYSVDCSELLLDKPKRSCIIDKEAIGFNIYNDNIYFIDLHRSLYKYSILNNQLSKIISSNVNSILVTLDKIFYINDSDRERIYVYDIQSGDSVVLPPEFIRNMNYCKDGVYFYDNNDVLYKYNGIEMTICD